MNEDNLELTEEIDNDCCRITVKGRVDSYSADQLLEKLEKALKDGKKSLVLNMAQVQYLSSIGIRVILKIYKDAKQAGCTFKIESPSQTVKNVLGILALKELVITG